MEKNYSSRPLDHLGLISGFCEEVGLVEHIDGALPSERKVSHGQSLLAMVLNGLGFTGRTLHMYPQYFKNKPLERLIGAGIEDSHLNDDSLGRTLDAFYEYGVSSLYESLAYRVVKHLGLPCEALNMDNTSFHVDGSYHQDGEEHHSVRLMKGYSRDHRPDLNQVVLKLITENQAGIPVYMQACDGNSVDSVTFKKLVKSHLKSLKAAYKNQYLIGDAALYTEETLKSMDSQEQYFITRVPSTLKEVKSLIQQHHELTFEDMGEGYHGCFHDSDYAGVRQRWLLIKSEQAAHRELASLKKRISKTTQQSLKAFKKLCRESFSCQQDASKALKDWLKNHRYVDVQSVSFNSVTHHEGRGRPSQSEAGTLKYHIQGDMATSLEQVELAKHQLGLFIIATNDIKGNLDMSAMLKHYKSQQKVEKGFRFLKSPEFLTASLFLKKPERIEALLMVMTCCLMVYAAIEHIIRERLQKANAFVPDMKGKPTNKPTARWIFHCFEGIAEFFDGLQFHVINLTDEQRCVIQTLGPPYIQVYS